MTLFKNKNYLYAALLLLMVNAGIVDAMLPRNQKIVLGVGVASSVVAAAIVGGYFAFQKACGNSPEECVNFFMEYCKRPEVIGAIAPSSPFLAKALADHIAPAVSGESRKLLEVGPGTGISTYAIIEKMGPTDELHLVELEAELCEILQKKFGLDHRIKIHNMSITDFNPGIKFDAVVMGIPFNSLNSALVKDIWTQVISLMNPSATLSYFNYRNLPAIKKLFLNNEERKDFQAIQTYIDSLYENYGKGYQYVAKNVPEARVRAFVFEDPAEALGASAG